MMQSFAKRRRASLPAAVSLLLFISVPAVRGQVTSGSITGSVQDATAAAVVGVNLKLTDTATTIEHSTTFDSPLPRRFNVSGTFT